MVFLLGLMACEKHQWDPPKWDYNLNENPVRPDRPLSYDIHVAPLFAKYACDGCHNGQIPPDLREANSESALVNGGYIDEEDAENSIVVIRINDPEHGGTWNTTDLFTLLDWIYEETNLK